MAIYHLSVKVISRANGSSALASAAYRSASRLRDDRLDRSHDFTNKSGVEHSEVMLPDNAPERMGDRESLWNEVEATELRRDAQLAREIEFAIPREMTKEQGIELARDFVQAEFVDHGMIADLNVHWDIGADGMAKPHAHVMVTMREVGEDGFGKKNREWNATDRVEEWRERWAEHANERLAELDIDARIDHRSFKDQGIDLVPQDKIGPAASQLHQRGLEADRFAEHLEIARSNGERIIADPNIALDAITRQQATFTKRDLAMFIHRHSAAKDQFDHAMSAVLTAPEIVALGQDGRGEERFTSRDMIEVEARLEHSTDMLAQRFTYRVSDRDRDRALASAENRGLDLTGEQRDAFDHATGGKDLSVVIGYAGTGKSAMLGVARDAWEQAGIEVRGAALSGIAAESLEAGSSIPSRTIASMEHQWVQGRDQLTSNTVLVIDEAGMIGSRQMERVLSHAADAGAKVVLVGDPQQLQSIEAGAAFRSIAERHGGIEITEIRRQQVDWQRDATRQLATGRTGEALDAYRKHGMVHAAETREAARGELIDSWDRERLANPDQSRLILTHTNDEVRALNELARERVREAGGLGEDVRIATERGARDFATGDRLMFLRNDRELGVKNGSLGQIEQVSAQSLTVRLDDGRSVAFDTKDYAHVDHGYAATVHKSQGVTVDRTHVLATPGLDSHASYVALSRHREGVSLHYSRDDFADADRLTRTLSRERTKDMASDYARAPEQRFAKLRGIEFIRAIPDKVRSLGESLSRAFERRFDNIPQVEIPQHPHEQQRSIFAGFNPPPVIEQVDRGAETLARRIETGVVRYAKSIAEIDRQESRGLEPMPHQISTRDKAHAELEALKRHTGRDAEVAFDRDPGLIGEASSGNTGRTIRAMQLEQEIRANPELRADRFVENWRNLSARLDAAAAHSGSAGFTRVRNEMAELARGLERDPQVDSILQNRKIELGLKLRMSSGDGIGHELLTSIGLGRGRGIGISM
jgi:Ti-type conjugative transfer relaxase TraA